MTNAIEGFSRQFRKVTKTKLVFRLTTASSRYCIWRWMMDITSKWTVRRQDWGVIYSPLSIFFGDRIPANSRNCAVRQGRRLAAALDARTDFRLYC